MQIDDFTFKRYEGTETVVEQIERQRGLLDVGAKLIGWHSRRKRAKWMMPGGHVITTRQIENAPEYPSEAFEQGYQFDG